MRIPILRIAPALALPVFLCGVTAGESPPVSIPHALSPSVSDEIVVILRDIPPSEGRLKIAGTTETVEGFRKIPISVRLRAALGGEMAVLKIPRGTDPDEAISSLRASPGIVHVSRNLLFSADLTPDDTEYPEQWSVRDAPPDKDIDTESAWDVTRGASSVLVGVIDTGIDTTHTDLKQNLINGFDFCNASQADSVLDAGGYWFRPVGDYADRDPFPFDEFGHGTHVAGIIGAKGDNATGIAGIAWNVKLMPLRAIYSLEMSLAPRYHLSRGNMADIIAALDRAREAGCRVVNMSFSGSEGDTLLHAAILDSYRAGMVLVASAGNAGNDSPRYPAAYPEVLAVSASSRYQVKASFSSFGDWVDVAAPGENIYSTTPMNGTFYLEDQIVSRCARDYGLSSGSSMAAAHVSGVAALLLSIRPELNVAQVMDYIRMGADPVGGYDYSGGRCREMGRGRVNAFNTLFHALGRGTVATDLTIRQNMDVTGDIVIPSGRTLEIGSGATLRIADGKRIRVSGILKVSEGARFTRTERGTYWSGIDIGPGGKLEAAGDLTIEYADCGIDLLDSNGISNGVHTITIRNCRQAGIWIDNCSPFLRNIVCERTSDRDFQNGGISVSGASAFPRLRNVKVADSYHGILVCGFSSALMDSSDIRNSAGDCIQVVEGSSINLNGANNICPAPGRRAINNSPSGRIDAGNNYWGENPDFNFLFSFPAMVDPSGYVTTMFDGIDRAAKPDSRDRDGWRALALKFEDSGEWSRARDVYLSRFSPSGAESEKREIIAALIRVQDRSGRDYREPARMVAGELALGQGTYREWLEHIRGGVLLREGRYEAAGDVLLESAENCGNGASKAAFLAGAARIYGEYLGDTVKAREFADRAAALDPGERTLRLAYDSAGTGYDPPRFRRDETKGPGPASGDGEALLESLSAFPNPANPSASIRFVIVRPARVTLSVYSITGQKVATLVDAPLRAGTHTVSFDGSPYASGVYIYRFRSGTLIRTGKILVVK